MYLDKGELEVGVMTRGMSWFDTGTVESLDDATEFIRVLQNRQSTMIGCIEEVAYRHQFINSNELKIAIEKYGKSKYGEYLKKYYRTIMKVERLIDLPKIDDYRGNLSFF